MRLIYLITSAILLVGCTSYKLVHENKYSVTYQHQNDRFSNLNDDSFYIKEVARDAQKKCIEKGYKTLKLTNSQCTEYCAKKYECVCITNFACKK